MEQTTIFGIGSDFEEASNEALQKLLGQIERHGDTKSATASECEARIRAILAEREQAKVGE